jgi:acyl-CoA synthetase (NDP forming)
LINSKSEEILGKRTYPDLLAVPDKVDLAVISTPAKSLTTIVNDAGKKGIPLLVIISSGLRENGPDRCTLEKTILTLARCYSIRIIGPNSFGLILPALGINTTFYQVSPKRGKIALISQSGAFITFAIDWSILEEIGFSCIFSLGTQVDLCLDDFIEYAGDDKNTNVIILYLEQIHDNIRLCELMNNVARKKPIIAIKGGDSQLGRKASISHNNLQPISQHENPQLLKQMNILHVESVREAFQVAKILVSDCNKIGRRTIVVTNAGGFAVLSCDYAEKFGVDLIELSPQLVAAFESLLPKDWSHSNPIDLIGDATADRFAKVFDVLLNHQNSWDMIVIIISPVAIIDLIQLAKEIVKFSSHTLNIIICSLSSGEHVREPLKILRDANIPNFSDFEDVFRAYGKICQHYCPSNDSLY